MKRRSTSSKNSASDPEWTFKSGSKEHNQGRSDDGSLQFWTERNVFIGCLLFRFVNALFIHTYFNPDEHWQALEVAHRVVFGYGHLTWEWEKGIRSYLHPMIFALLYKTLAILKLDTLWFMMSNWFMFFCITRTLSNSLETVLITVSLFYWPFHKFLSSEACDSPRSRKLALLFAALSCAIRPTSAIVWLYIGILHFYETHDKTKFLIFDVLPIGTSVLIVTCLLDRWMYGSWIFVPLNFLKFNFFSAGGDYYGTHPWHWYFTQGFPAIVFTFLPISVAGVWLSKEWQLAGLIGWVLGLYSLLGHKEFRFVLPVLPITLMFSGYLLAELDKPDFSQRKLGKSGKTRKWSSWKYFVVFGLLITNIPAALYTSLVHQRGSEAVMAFLAREADKHQVQSVTFLMQCHSTPYYASLHRNLTMQFLDCSPRSDNDTNISVEELIDESDRFMRDPVSFVLDMFGSLPLPSHLVLFDSQAVQLREVLALHGYVQVQRFFHAHFPVDRELQGYVVVYQQTG